jgi:hypothetical protein
MKQNEGTRPSVLYARLEPWMETSNPKVQLQQNESSVIYAQGSNPPSHVGATPKSTSK